MNGLGFTEAQLALYHAVRTASDTLDGQLLALSDHAATADPRDLEAVRRWLNDQVVRASAR